MRFIALSLLVLAGCATDDRANHERQAAEYRAGVEGQCRAYGFTEGSPEFRDCLMRVDMTNRQAYEANRQMLLQQYINQQGIFRR